MPRKRSVEELEAAAKKAEARAKKLRQQAAERTRADEARLNVELIKAVEEWRVSWPEDKRYSREQLPGYFRAQAEKNRQRFGGKE